jgi:hypothetical protein
MKRGGLPGLPRVPGTEESRREERRREGRWSEERRRPEEMDSHCVLTIDGPVESL